MSTPLKKGLGDYTKGEKFTLKSGNSPAFKMMGNVEAGDSPITNEFGIGKGTSPYQMAAPPELTFGQKAASVFMGGVNAVYGGGSEGSDDDKKNKGYFSGVRVSDDDAKDAATTDTKTISEQVIENQPDAGPIKHSIPDHHLAHNQHGLIRNPRKKKKK